MKRSEMVKIIEKAMRCWNGAYYNQSLESHILEYIEEAGMLPPSVLDVPVGSPLSEFAEVILKDFDLLEIEEHVWEPEDD